MQNLQDFLVGLTQFINNVLIPLVFTIALLFFIWHAFRFFILEAGESDARENAKSLALYGIGAFVLLVSLWGIINLIVDGLGWQRSGSVCPDYFEKTGWCSTLPDQAPIPGSRPDTNIQSRP